jgi:hypothetical protein
MQGPVPFSKAPELIAEAVKSSSRFPGWQQDLGLVREYKEEISQAFQDAEIKGSQLRKDAATGKMWVSSGTLHGLISDATKEVFLEKMTPMWEKAWRLGYESAGQLLGKTSQDHGDHLQNFLDTEGAHWLEQVSRTGLGNSNARSEIIARTEVARAINDGAMQCYRDNGVTHKHLAVAPDDACDICTSTADDGIIPLDAPFSHGGLSGPVTRTAAASPFRQASMQSRRRHISASTSRRITSMPVISIPARATANAESQGKTTFPALRKKTNPASPGC